MPKIFISYRREDSQHQADRLHAALKKAVRDPKRAIFMDVDNIPVGVDFVQHLDAKVAECDVLLALIGPDWLRAGEGLLQGRRLDDPKDFVRIEIASALKRGIPVAPVLLDGAPMPKESELPADLKPLARRQAAEIRRVTFDADAERMIRGLNLSQLGRTAPKQKPAEPPDVNWTARVAVISLIALAGGGAWVWLADPLGLKSANGGARLASTAEGGGGGSARSGETEGVSPRGDSGKSTATASAPPATTKVDAPPQSPPGETPSVSRLDGRDPPPPPSAVEASAAPSPASRAWAKLDRADAVQLRKFLAAHGASPEAETARFALSKLDAEAWADALGRNTEDAFNAYLSAFPAKASPAGAHASEAQARIDALRLAEAARLPLPRSGGGGSVRSAETEGGSPRGDSADPAASAFAAAASGGPVSERAFHDCSGCPEMVAIPAGSFLMGSPASEAGRFEDEGPQRRVSLPAFAASKYEVTWAEWDRCVADAGCPAIKDDGYGGGSRPATGVWWDYAEAYTRWLSRKTGKTYRLLSEAEWEYAARGGTVTAYWWGRLASHKYANYGKDRCCGGLASGVDRWVNTSPAGSFDTNPFGLHDMHGNVWEWVEDCYENSYSAGQPTDGSAFTKGSCSNRVLRGGSWGSSPMDFRSARRYGTTIPIALDHSPGFRVARTL